MRGRTGQCEMCCDLVGLDWIGLDWFGLEAMGVPKNRRLTTTLIADQTDSFIHPSIPFITAVSTPAPRWPRIIKIFSGMGATTT
jgi:hypothetical protein